MPFYNRHSMMAEVHFGHDFPRIEKVSSCPHSYWLHLGERNRHSVAVTFHATSEGNPLAQRWLAYMHEASVQFWSMIETEESLAAPPITPPDMDQQPLTEDSR